MMIIDLNLLLLAL